MRNNNWIRQCRVISGFWVLLYFGAGTVLANSWQDEPEARQQLHQVGLELALADVHPKLTLWWQQATGTETASDVADDRLLLGIQSFWRHWASLSFMDRQHLRTRQAELSYTDSDQDNLRLASQLQRRFKLVEGITPNFANYSQLQQQLTHLLAQKQTAWPALRTATVRPGDRRPVIEQIRERLRILGDMPEVLDLNTPLVPDGDDVPQLEVELKTAETLQEPVLNQNRQGSVAAVRNALQGEDSRVYEHSALDSSEFIDPLLYDVELESAVRSFQQRHGLTVDGVIGPKTYAWLDARPLARAQLLMRSMMRTLISDELPDSYLLVNIPEYHMRLYQDQVMVLDSNIIVGSDRRRTPIMMSKITHVVFNPPWNVPRSIINKDIVPKLYRDPSYIERQGFDVLEGGNKVPREVWQTRLEEGGGFPYHLRQRPSRGNALGAYKFHLPTTNAIYLHDTPSRSLFGRDSRALSSGCVRVEGAEQLANWLVAQRLGSRKLAALKAKPSTTWVKVADPLPLFMVYWPGWLSADGVAYYRKDIYQYDKGLNNPF